MQIQLVNRCRSLRHRTIGVSCSCCFVPILDTEKIAFDEGFVANGQSSATCQDLEPVIVANAPGPFDMNRSAQVQ
jgi:hypothetical protein